MNCRMIARESNMRAASCWLCKSSTSHKLACCRASFHSCSSIGHVTYVQRGRGLHTCFSLARTLHTTAALALVTRSVSRKTVRRADCITQAILPSVVKHASIGSCQELSAGFNHLECQTAVMSTSRARLQQAAGHFMR